MYAGIIALVLSVVLGVGIGSTPALWTGESSAQHAPDMTEEQEWQAFHADAVQEHSEAFTALFDSYETKWSKNGRLMIRQGNNGPYKFAGKG